MVRNEEEAIIEIKFHLDGISQEGAVASKRTQ